jgi:hypothetical protein
MEFGKSRLPRFPRSLAVLAAKQITLRDDRFAGKQRFAYRFSECDRLSVMPLRSIQECDDEAGIDQDRFHDLPNPSRCFLLVAKSGLPEQN